LLMPDGSIKYLHNLAHLSKDDAGNVEIVGAIMDITERKRAEEALRRNEAYLVDAQKLSHTGSLGWRPSTGEIFWSEETFRIFECDPATKPTVVIVLERVHPEDRAKVQKQIELATQDGKDFDLQHRLLMPDGAVKHVQVVAHALADELGTVEFVGAVVDVTDAKQAEDRIRLIINAVPGLLWSAGPDGSADFLSQRCLDYTGMTLEQSLGWGWEPVIHPDDREDLVSRWRTAVAERKPHEAVSRIRRFDGAYRWCLSQASPLLDRTGGVLGWYGNVVDVHERTQAEERLRQQEAELRQILDLTPQLVAVYGPNRERLYANRSMLQHVGRTLEEWRLRFQFGEALHPEDRERAIGLFDSAVSSAGGFELELRLRKGDGSYRWFLTRGNPGFDDKGQIMRWYVVCVDIEDRKRAEENLQKENLVLREEIDKVSMFEEIVGGSVALQDVLTRVSLVAPTDSTVLITGETGTGKELIARAIHKRSTRSSRAFVSVNCAAIPQNLIASELFGHEKGAFTGALQRRLGRFELAEAGTIFLDEVGDLPAETQIALLRVLQERKFERLGGNQTIVADIRVIAATNRDLQLAIAGGSFRSDLFFRLNVFPIEIPSLRDRKEDIPILVEYFIGRFARTAGKKIRTIPKESLDLLESYSWPGNIRELQNIIERSVIVSETDTLSVDASWLSLSSRAHDGGRAPAKKSRAKEKDLIEAALTESEGRVSGPLGAAVRLGMPGSTLESKIRSLKINKYRFKKD